MLVLEQLVTVAVKVSSSRTVSFVHPPEQEVIVSTMVAMVEFLVTVIVLLLIATECFVTMASEAATEVEVF